MSGPQSADLGDTLDHTVQRRVLDAALDTLLAKRVGSFTLEGVAVRSGISAAAIRRIWPNTPELFSATLKTFGERYLPIPDTGTLEGDLLEYARSYAATLNSAVGRRMLDAIIVKREDWDLTDSRELFLVGRKSKVSTIIQRGIERGECPPETDTVLAIDMLATGLMLPVLFFDHKVDDAHCGYVVKTILYGITEKR